MHKFLAVSTIFLLDLGIVPTLLYVFFIFVLFLTICTTEGTCTMCNLFVRIHVDEEIKLYNVV